MSGKSIDLRAGSNILMFVHENVPLLGSRDQNRPRIAWKRCQGLVAPLK